MDRRHESTAFIISSVSFEADASGCPIDRLPHFIRKRAYELYEARRRQSGRELDDWLQVERELRPLVWLNDSPQFKAVEVWLDGGRDFGARGWLGCHGETCNDGERPRE